MADPFQTSWQPESPTQGGAVLRLVPGARHAPSPADLLLEAVARLQAPDDLPTLRLVVVESVERLMRGCAAALFLTHTDPGLTTLCASGPGWRTAERDGPAWLKPLCRTLAELVRADTRMAGRLVRGRDQDGPDLALLPLAADDDQRQTLVVAWPEDTPAAAADLAMLDRLAPFVAAALRRAGTLEAWRAAAGSMRAAQAELVAGHAERAAASLAGGVAHELNNVLSVLLGVSELLLASDALDPQARGDVEAIHGAARATARLAQRLAFIGRPSREGDADLVDAVQVVSRAAERVRAEREGAVADQPFRLEASVGEALVLTVSGDLADTVTSLLRLQAEASGRARLEIVGGEVALVTEGPAVPGFAEGDAAVAAYTRATRWRGPVLAACRRVAQAHGWRFVVEAAGAARQRITLAVPLASPGAQAGSTTRWC